MKSWWYHKDLLNKEAQGSGFTTFTAVENPYCCWRATFEALSGVGRCIAELLISQTRYHACPTHPNEPILGGIIMNMKNHPVYKSVTKSKNPTKQD